MSQKRHQHEDAKHQSGKGTDSGEDKRQRTFRSVVLEVMNLQRLQHLMEPVLEPLIRRVVKEEVDTALRKYVISMKRNCTSDVYPSESRSLQLRFLSVISLPVFTGTRIEGEDFNNLKVALLDALTGQVVSSGSEASARVEIVVLEGDFDSDEGDNWNSEEFKNNIVREREGKKPLLSGDVFFTLKDGVGMVGDISFSDNSSWTRSRKFRLGARVVDIIDGISIREAKSESFIVRDHRGELYKKHHPPSMADEVWRLEKIGKDGAFHKRLSKERVNTVKDFLTLFYLDPVRLRNVLGTGMSAKMWEVTVEHAQKCLLDPKVHVYYPPGSPQTNGVVFNVVGQLKGLIMDSQLIPADKLSEAEKADARNLIISAYRDWDKVFTFDNEASVMGFSSSLNANPSSSNLPLEGSCGNSGNFSSNEVGRCSYSQQNTSSPDVMQSIYSMGSFSSLDNFLNSIDPMDITFDEPLNFSGQVGNTLFCDADSMSQGFGANEQVQYFGTSCALQATESPADLQNAINVYLSRPPAAPVKAQRRWKMLFSVQRWFSVRRYVRNQKAKQSV